jgi:hypothetical protein
MDQSTERQPAKVRSRTWAVLALTVLGWACDTSQTDPAPAGPQTPSPPTRTGSSPIFVDQTADAGIEFVHFNGMTGEMYIVEMMGAGGALFDYDNDGDLDLWLRQGAMLNPRKTIADALFPPADPDQTTDRLYRNDLEVAADGSRRLSFTDVTDQTGVEIRDYGMGVAAADYDHDGDVDLYLTNFGPNRFLQNDGDGSFTDVTAATGTEDDRWSVPAVFVDVDRDGWLDLYEGNYLDFSIANHKQCFRPSSAEDYCGPLSYRPVPDRLFRNRGDGTFVDITAASGLAAIYGTSLGVLATDFDRDGAIDLYVANDAQENFLWINRGDGTFFEDALLRGVAVNSRGEREGSMGVATGDYDENGAPDIFVTHMATETNTLYVNDGEAMFRDVTLMAGLATVSRPLTGFGTSWIDYDNSGRLGLLILNGAVTVIEALERAGDPFPLHQRNQLFRNLGDRRFEDLGARAGAAFELTEVSRGAIMGDVDNDGDMDFVVANNNGPARLFRNEVGHRRHWVGFRLTNRHGRTPQGARVELIRSKGAPMVRWAGTDGSYCSAQDPRVLFGLGEGGSDVTGVRVDWPAGVGEVFSLHALDGYIELIEGEGDPLPHD